MYVGYIFPRPLRWLIKFISDCQSLKINRGLLITIISKCLILRQIYIFLIEFLTVILGLVIEIENRITLSLIFRLHFFRGKISRPSWNCFKINKWLHPPPHKNWWKPSFRPHPSTTFQKSTINWIKLKCTHDIRIFIKLEPISRIGNTRVCSRDAQTTLINGSTHVRWVANLLIMRRNRLILNFVVQL